MAVTFTQGMMQSTFGLPLDTAERYMRELTDHVRDAARAGKRLRSGLVVVGGQLDG